LPQVARLPFGAADGAGKTLFVPPPPPANTTPESARAATAPSASPAALYEYALTSAAMSFYTAAIEALQEATSNDPDFVEAWHKLAELLRYAGNDAEANKAEATAASIPAHRTPYTPAVGEQAPAKLHRAERRLRAMLQREPSSRWGTVLRDHLFQNTTDVVALRLLADVELAEGDAFTAQTLLARAVELSPFYTGARAAFARLLMERRNHVRALAETAHLVTQAPREAQYRAMRADTLAHTGDYPAAIALLEGLLREDPRASRLWLAYGNALHFVGRRDEGIKAYRTCLDLVPTMGEAYWGIADIKGNFLTDSDITAMRAHLAAGDLAPSSRMHMLYALAHAMERARDYAGAFAAYDAGARTFREIDAAGPKPYDPEVAAERVRRLKRVFTNSNMAARTMPAGAAAAAAGDTPIFVVGMPRAGSTLVEQILASHSQVEGTRELSVIGDITRDLMVSRRVIMKSAYPDCVLDLSQEQRAALGSRYIEDARIYRSTARPYFIDKRPWNWMDAGLIHLILPHAKIIDVRREPMAACFAMFKQLLPGDAAFSYDLTELGRYYNRYAGMMDHYEAAMPGRIHFLRYENLVEDTEAEIRRLLDYCGLPFEEGCLRFWETERTVATPSAEQVRRPIFRDALQLWRNYEPWLGPLKAALAMP